jgi:hypothetical protein
MSETSTFDINAFINESKETLVNPKSHFSSMKTSGGMAEPIIKAVIYGAVAGAFVFLWSILGLGAIKAGFLGGAVGAMAFVWYIVAAVIGLFVGAVIMLIISSVCRGNTDFEANVRVTASVMVIMPISALLGFTGGISLFLGTVIGIGVNLFALYLVYNGLTESLKATPRTSRVAICILAGLVVLFMLMGMSATRKLNRMMGKDDLKELIRDERKTD